MPQSFSYTLKVPAAPSEAVNRARFVVTERLRDAAGMQLRSESSSTLSFAPHIPVHLPISSMRAIFHRLRGENVSMTFSAADGGTQVTVAGKVARKARAVADQQFWTGMINAA